MSDISQRDFMTGAMVFATAISGACAALERTYIDRKKKLPTTGEYTDEELSSMVTAGLMLTFFGLIADNEEGRRNLQLAASKMRSKKYPSGEEIRRVVNELCDEIGLVDHRHRWN